MGASLMAQPVNNPPAMQEIWVWSLGWEDTLEKGIAYPLQYSVHRGKSHGDRSLVGYSPWCHRELDTTEQLTHTHTHIHTPSWRECLHWILIVACGICFPNQGSNLGLWHWAHKVLAPGPPGKSPGWWLGRGLSLGSHLASPPLGPILTEWWRGWTSFSEPLFREKTGDEQEKVVSANS